MNTRKNILSMCIVATFGILAFGSLESDGDAKKISSQAPAFEVSAQQLYRDYEANEVSADAKYKDKVIIVSGRVVKIAKSITDEAYIVLETGTFAGVQCMFSKSGQDALARLTQGQSGRVKGKVYGKMMNVLISGSNLQ